MSSLYIPTRPPRLSSDFPQPHTDASRDDTSKETAVKITGIDARVLKPLDYTFRWKEEWPARTLEHVLLRITTDEGHEGLCITWLMSAGEIESALPGLRALLIGQDPHMVEAISYKLTDRLQTPARWPAR